MRTTIGVKAPDFSSGRAIVSPLSIAARDLITASWITRFPAVLAVTSSPCRIDTPDATSVPSVRVNLDTAALRSRSPTNGTRQHQPVHASRRPLARAVHACRTSSASTGTAPARAHQYR